MSEETVQHPYLKQLGDRDALEVLQATPAELRRLLDPLSPEQVEHRPAPGKWNLREIMAHMADCEIAWSWRQRQVYGEDNPVLQPFEQDAWAKAYLHYTMAQARATWEALRAWNVTFLGGVTEQDRARPATHPESGSMTLWMVASIAAGHDLHHLHSLERVVEGLKTGPGV